VSDDDSKLEVALLKATSALLAMRMGARDRDFGLIQAAVMNLMDAGQSVHMVAGRLGRKAAKA
jgi:hypothetical protein